MSSPAAIPRVANTPRPADSVSETRIGGGPMPSATAATVEREGGCGGATEVVRRNWRSSSDEARRRERAAPAANIGAPPSSRFCQKLLFLCSGWLLVKAFWA